MFVSLSVFISKNFISSWMYSSLHIYMLLLQYCCHMLVNTLRTDIFSSIFITNH
jgi:hypothetical protein